MKIKYLPYLCFVFLMFGCSQIKQRKINLEEFRIAKMKPETIVAQDSCSIVNIIEYFPNKEKCGTSKQLANLYVCKEDSGDTLYVFADCDIERRMPFDKGVCIMGEDIKRKFPKEIVVSVPDDFVIPKGAKYIFSNLLWLVD